MDTLPAEIIERIAGYVGPDPTLRGVNRSFRRAFDWCVRSVTVDARDVSRLPVLPNLLRLTATHVFEDFELPRSIESVELTDADVSVVARMRDALDRVPEVTISLQRHDSADVSRIPLSTTSLEVSAVRSLAGSVELPRMHSLKIGCLEGLANFRRLDTLTSLQVKSLDGASVADRPFDAISRLTSLTSLGIEGSISFQRNTFATALTRLTKLRSLSLRVTFFHQPADTPDLRQFARVALLPELTELTFVIVVMKDHTVRYSTALVDCVRLKPFRRLTVLANHPLAEPVKDWLLTQYDVTGKGTYEWNGSWKTMTLTRRLEAA